MKIHSHKRKDGNHQTSGAASGLQPAELGEKECVSFTPGSLSHCTSGYGHPGSEFPPQSILFLQIWAHESLTDPISSMSLSCECVTLLPSGPGPWARHPVVNGCVSCWNGTCSPLFPGVLGNSPNYIWNRKRQLGLKTRSSQASPWFMRNWH